MTEYMRFVYFSAETFKWFGCELARRRLNRTWYFLSTFARSVTCALSEYKIAVFFIVVVPKLG